MCVCLLILATNSERNKFVIRQCEPTKTSWKESGLIKPKLLHKYFTKAVQFSCPISGVGRVKQFGMCGLNTESELTGDESRRSSRVLGDVHIHLFHHKTNCAPICVFIPTFFFCAVIKTLNATIEIREVENEIKQFQQVRETPNPILLMIRGRTYNALGSKLFLQRQRY